MMARSHIVIGSSAWAIYSIFSGAPLSPLLVFVSAAASLLPDIDHPTSAFGSRVKPVSMLISAIFGHRGITHSLLSVFFLSWVITKYGNVGGYFVAAACVGYLSHLLADFMTPFGVPLLYPFKYKFRSPVTVSTGGIGENLIVGLVFVFSIHVMTNPNMQYINFDMPSVKGIDIAEIKNMVTSTINRLT